MSLGADNCLRCMGLGKVYDKAKDKLVECACVTSEEYRKKLENRLKETTDEAHKAEVGEKENEMNQASGGAPVTTGAQATADGSIRVPVQPRPMAKEAEMGQFKARAVKGSEQFGVSAGDAQTLQIGIDMQVAMKAGDFIMTTMLFFSAKAAPFSIQRLQALGWKGSSTNDLVAALAEGAMHLEGIERNIVDVDIRCDDYQGRPQWRCEINGGPGKVQMVNLLDPREFAARLRVAAASVAGGGLPAAGTSQEAPPF
jgi:hypothetical protein